jgi:hypothetical protein
MFATSLRSEVLSAIGHFGVGKPHQQGSILNRVHGASIRVTSRFLGLRIFHIELVLEQVLRIVLLLHAKERATSRVCRAKLLR